MMNFEFQTATHIVFGDGAVAQASIIAKDLGRRAFVVTGRDASRAESLIAQLSDAGLGVTTFAVVGEPEIATVEQGAQLARAEQCD